VEDADGFHVSLVDIVTDSWIDVRYDIDVDQEPVEATVVVTDGLVRYEVPFYIVSPAAFSTIAQDQDLTKGRVGWVVFSNPNAALHQATSVATSDETVETGDAEVVDSTEVTIPVRVPFDYPHESMLLTAVTYSQGGAFMETMTAEVDLLEPAWLATMPSRLDQVEGQQTLDLVTAGCDLNEVISIEANGPEGVTLAGWSATTADTGTIAFDIASNAGSGAIELAADDGRRIIRGVAGIPPFAFGAWEAETELARGDHLLLPVVVYGGDLGETDIAVSDDDGVQVVGWTRVDDGALVIELAIGTDAAEGFRTLVVTSGEHQFNVDFQVIGSGL